MSHNPCLVCAIKLAYITAKSKRETICIKWSGSILKREDANTRVHLFLTSRFLDRAAITTLEDMNPWQLCTVTQIEEVKCILRLLPVWLCTIFPSVVFIQMLSLFVEQGAAMNTIVSNFRIPPASMTAFDIVSTSTFIISYEAIILPLYVKLTKKETEPPSELQRLGIGKALAILAMIIEALWSNTYFKRCLKHLFMWPKWSFLIHKSQTD